MPSVKYTRIEITQEAYMALEAEAILQGKTVNYPALKDGACDYAKSRVASGGLTKPPWDSKIYLKSRVLCSMFIAPARSAWVS